MLENKNNLKAWLYLSPALLLLIVFTFYPLFNAFNLAFLKDFNFLLRTTEGYTLFGNFKIVINSPNFKQAMINTFFIVFVSVPISVMVALVISVLLNSVKKFQGFFQTVYFLPYVTNAIAVGMAFAFIFHQDYGLINTMLGWIGINPINWVGTGASWGGVGTTTWKGRAPIRKRASSARLTFKARDCVSDRIATSSPF